MYIDCIFVLVSWPWLRKSQVGALCISEGLSCWDLFLFGAIQSAYYVDKEIMVVFLHKRLSCIGISSKAAGFVPWVGAGPKSWPSIGISLVGHIYQYLFAVLQGYRSMAAIWRHFIHCISFFIWGIDHPSSMDKPPYYYIAFQ